MNWRDFFYFSKGERQALILLLVLVAAAWLTVMFTDSGRQGLYSEAGTVYNPVCIYLPDSGATATDSNTPTATDGSTVTAEVRKERREAVPPPVSSKRPFYQPFPKAEKFPAGTVVELNTADTVTLKKVPGIGSAFSRRIVKYRELMGGFYSITQLAEVYGMDEERYEAVKGWFCVNPLLIRKLAVNALPADSLARHPYINYRQARVIKQYVKQKGRLNGWEDLFLSEEFSEADRTRMAPYLSFE
ncbi:comEA protein [Bacteroidales bacterium Barb4]|nr:comEA protein [Bacteroidales bacterium Barb4]